MEMESLTEGYTVLENFYIRVKSLKSQKRTNHVIS